MMKNKLIALFTLITVVVNAQHNEDRILLLELFTSQGCSSCPPADELLDQVYEQYKDKGVYVLSYHVDYWNRLGWRDPFSSALYSDYQREYANRFNSTSIYTPQVVINGKVHFVGSDRTKMKQVFEIHSITDAFVHIDTKNVQRSDHEIVLSYQVEGEGIDRISAVVVVEERTTSVKRGENRNRTLKNSNIVVSKKVSTASNGDLNLQLPDWITSKDRLSVLVYAQNDNLEVLGVSKHNLSH